MDGEADGEGRVEVCYEGQWGTVCNDWPDNNLKFSFGRLACTEIGYINSMNEI